MIMKDRTVLITGGTSGIGLSLATKLAERGNVVIITGQNQGKIDKISKEYPKLNVLRCDVTRPEDIQNLHDTVLSRFPALDVLVNNAGIMRKLNLTDPCGVEDVTREVDILLTAPIRIAQQFLPHLLRQKSAAILNVSSGLAFVPMSISPVYCAAKAGLHSYTQSLRAQLEGTAIKVFELAPPPVETKLSRAEFAEEMKAEKFMLPEKLVESTIAAIEADKMEITPGPAIVLKIASRVAPGLMMKQMARFGR